MEPITMVEIIAKVYGVVMVAIKKAKAFKPELEKIKLLLKSLDAEVKAIDELNKIACRTPYKPDTLVRIMKEGKKLVNECSKVEWWNFVKQQKYTNELHKFAESLRSYMQINVQAQQLRYIKEIFHELQRLKGGVDHKEDMKKILHELWRLKGQTGGVDHKEVKKINSDVDHKKQKPKEVNSDKKIYPERTSNERKKEEPKKINSDVGHKGEPKKQKEEPKKKMPKKIDSDKTALKKVHTPALKMEEPKDVNSGKKAYSYSPSEKVHNEDSKKGLKQRRSTVKEEPKKINSDVDHKKQKPKNHKEEPKKIDNGFCEFAEVLMSYSPDEFREFAGFLMSYTPTEVPVQPKKINSDVDHKEEPNKVNSDKKIHA